MIQVDIWSDVVCPFCYIGKHKFEKALKQFSKASEVEVRWHTFLLDPNTQKGPQGSIYEKLAKKYGRDLDWAIAANERVVQMAAEENLNFQMDQIIPNNSVDAHRLIHLARASGKEQAMHEKLFAAYFIEGKDISDTQTLVSLGTSVGLDSDAISKMLSSDDLKDAVHAEYNDALAKGIHAVPAFVFNQKYLVSGAQPSEVFLETLEKIKSA